MKVHEYLKLPYTMQGATRIFVEFATLITQLGLPYEFDFAKVDSSSGVKLNRCTRQ
jgi:hypothetical protein